MKNTFDRVGAAEFLGISVTTLDRIVKKGEITYIPVSQRRIVFRPEDLQSYLDKRAQEAKN
ncbi:MAG: helix-turn-helix domain-containing protein [Armatimonadetes bacterium]|nr:helix-turn-helix domain-containing protein [Armatimonadota bacterium]